MKRTTVAEAKIFTDRMTFIKFRNMVFQSHLIMKVIDDDLVFIIKKLPNFYSI